jgi:molecular chaperone DnaK
MDLGIDLGTTNSAVAGYTASGLRIFKTAEGADVLPSAIYIHRSGRRFYGKKAYDHAVISPENTAQGFKRLMGTSTSFNFADSGQSLTPEKCSAEILRQLLAQAYLESGEQQVTGAIITIPAAFNQMQCEATLRAAHAAGLEKVGLLQEPVAAAMAAMMKAEKKSGQFLVYDLGGGTFDLALVQSLNREISILDHEGINMLGGRDFDKAIVNGIVRPWLLENFDLPADLQKYPRYLRVIRIAQLAAERAKIDISTKNSEFIHAPDDEVRVQDESGADIYLDVELTRRDLEKLAGERVDESIELARKVLKKNGYSHDDIDRVVFIGGPTKMPLIRDRVPQQLGIAGDPSVDPMTAVALGAAIFAESRDWSAAASTRKPSRGSATMGGPLEVTYDYQARTTGDSAVLRGRVRQGAAGHDLQVDSHDGWTSGRSPLVDGIEVRLPLGTVGEHRFRITVFDQRGRPVPSASAELTIVRTYTSASGTPATHNIAVKIRESDLSEVNTLAPFLKKETTTLPAESTLKVRAARALRSGEAGHIEIELFQQDRPEVPQPELNLFIGAFRIEGKDLPDGQVLGKGDEIRFHWQMDEGGILTASVELPDLHLHFEERRFYVPQAGHRSFEGENGTRLAASALDEAEYDLERAEAIVGNGAAEELEPLRQRLARQREQLEQSFDADGNRVAAEGARHLRQDVAIILDKPEHRGAALSRELTELKSAFNYQAREIADADQVKRFDELAGRAAQEIVRGRPGFDTAKHQLAEMRAVMQRVLWSDPAFIADVFNTLAEDSYRAIDPALHDRLVDTGRKALLHGDVDGVRDIVFEMISNRISPPTGGSAAAALATIMRA